MSVVEDAVIVAGGLGSRMLPTSAYLPKEALPLVDVPAFIHLILEAANAGVSRIHIITSPKKNFDSFFQNNGVYSQLRPEISEALFSPFEGLEFYIHVQNEPLGLGHALMQSLSAISGPFIILLGDNIITREFSSITNFKASDASKKLVMAYEKHSLPCAGIYSLPKSEVVNYGVVKLDNGQITQVVEKPNPSEAPSNKVLCGRYIFAADSRDLLTNVFSVDNYGEMQTIELQKYWMESIGYIGVDLSEYQWYDSGNPLSWLKAQIDYGLRNLDYSSELKTWLSDRLK